MKKIKTQKIKKLKKLFNYFNLYEYPCIDFILKIKKLLPKVKDEIKNVYLDLNTVSYNRFLIIEIEEINELISNQDEYNLDKIKVLFNNYNFTFNKLENLFYLSKETGLYKDLSETIKFLPDEELAQNIFTIQKEVLNFIKMEIVKDLTIYLNILNIDPTINITKPYPNIFMNVDIYNAFEKYTELHIIDPYVDYSFLFQKILEENMIRHIKHKEFMNWLNKNNYISDNTLEKFLNKRSFSTVKKSFSESRENNFNNIFKQ